ncbi:MAG: hypothetical protein DRG09_00300 [Epsilonproteobacteria bacterium]|nr:MAG: hypothetical protein DRG09_00300 [Campylobacterota bacterium]
MNKMIFVSNPLAHLQKRLEAYYQRYKKGEMSEEEYLMNVKPIDKEIYHLEMYIFKRYYLDTSLTIHHTKTLQNA